jgi:cell division septum initiation protein DivIVA
MNLQKLQLENQELKRKLQIAEAWMRREVRQQVARISEEQQEESMNFDENAEEIISQKITDFIGEILLLNIPASVMENIISAEI